jgi:hypothetical protein
MKPGNDDTAKGSNQFLMALFVLLSSAFGTMAVIVSDRVDVYHR